MNLQSTVVFDQIDSRNIIGTRSLPKHNQSNVSSESILSLGRGERSEQVAADDKTTARMFRWASRVAGTPGATQGSRKTSRKRWYGLKDLAPERRINAEWQMIAGAPENASEALGRQVNAGAPG